jgi:hypothetical protein
MTSTDIDLANPLHRLVYLANSWGAEVRLRGLGIMWSVSVETRSRTHAICDADTVSEAVAGCLAKLEALTAEEDAREAAAEVAS